VNLWWKRLLKVMPSLGSWQDITSLSDERVRLYSQLTDVQLRSVLEPAEGIFVAEGAKVIERALRAGFTPLSVLGTSKWLGIMDAQEIVPADIPRYVADEAVLESLTGYQVHRGALALMRRKPTPSVETLTTSARRVVLLEDLKEHTNVGAIIRSAAAFGADAVLVSKACADPLYRRAVKVSMGTVFQVPWTVVEDWDLCLTQLAARGFSLVALTPSADAQDLRAFAASEPDRVAIVLGTEGPGLSRSSLDRCGVKVRIPMSAGVDSLNVAAAAAVALFALQP
jgi:tRNA G18 (ribose-2'-O)-methylase SpoU